MGVFDSAVAGLLPFVPKPLVGRFSRPYIAGSTLSEAVAVVRNLNRGGVMATLDVLGEGTRGLKQADAAAESYRRVLGEIQRTGIDSNVSVKPTQLGLQIDADACYRNIREIVQQAAGPGELRPHRHGRLFLHG